MSIKIQILAGALALALAGGALAQAPDAQSEQLRQELREAKRQLAEIGQRVAELSMQLGDDEARVRVIRHLGNPDRAVIGVILADGESDGVGVQGVSPGGPADKAGLRAGDVIIAVRGASLAGEHPQQALREALKDLKAGDKVAIRWRRDGREQSSEITAERQGSFAFFGDGGARAFTFDSDGGEWAPLMGDDFDKRIEAIVERSLDGPGGLHLNINSMFGLGGLRLSSLNPGLARYFGTSEGALVLDVDEEKYRGLEAGDVILEIDGKPVKDPRDAMRELGRHDASDRVALKLQRERVTQMVDITLPEKGARAFLLPPAPPAPPAPPVPPAAPAPPAAPGEYPMSGLQVIRQVRKAEPI